MPCFNPSTGLSVFQTSLHQSIDDVLNRFQSLDWVERLSDPVTVTVPVPVPVFQSLDWVERLSDVHVLTARGLDSAVSIPRLG